MGVTASSTSKLLAVKQICPSLAWVPVAVIKIARTASADLHTQYRLWAVAAAVAYKRRPVRHYGPRIHVACPSSMACSSSAVVRVVLPNRALLAQHFGLSSHLANNAVTDHAKFRTVGPSLSSRQHGSPLDGARW